MRTSVRFATVLALAFAATFAVAKQLPAQEDAESGWTALFNGKDFDGWDFHLGKEGADNKGTLRSGTES